MPDRSVAIELESVGKRFGKAAAVRGVTLSILEGEFFSLLGPSGCGKTTTLRMIAGFEVPDEGRILLQGEDVHHGHAEPAAGQHGLPAVRALPAHVDLRQRRVRAEGEARPALASTAARSSEMLRVVELEGCEQRAPAPALGRPAAARRARARARQPAGGAAARRAARSTRREAAQADAARAEAHPARARDDIRLRHARPGRGARDVRPDRRHERRPGRADRRAARDLRAPGDRLRRRLHRLAERARLQGRRARRRVRGDAARRAAIGSSSPVGPDTQAGDSLRVAVRPERVQIGRPGPRAGRRLECRGHDRRDRLSRHVHAVPRRHAGRPRRLPPPRRRVVARSTARIRVVLVVGAGARPPCSAPSRPSRSSRALRAAAPRLAARSRRRRRRTARW